MMRKKMKCPFCCKRAFDISKLPKDDDIEIELKCPHCRRFVTIKCNELSVMEIQSNNVSSTES